MIEKELDILEKTRALILKMVEPLSIDQINIIPPGFNNNVAWNFAHLVVTQQLICYKLSGVDGYIDEEKINRYRKGTAPDPQRKMTGEEFKYYKEQFILNVERLKKDYHNHIFTSYTSYTTSVNVTLNNIEEAVAFNNVHEGIHLGTILALRKLI
ncbi:DinB family protein [Abyssalbus ytuae]|uniref:DinB family protein n=1 Tax=Abyssalbus ytuae TaxID=2926907 RepID=A0A9E6ZRD5_9FLAO|nr:DinB family protein [Abyssalbus ytuae]UOB19155.1 DinB family protein [Abyssalbus ytuae]